MPDSVFMLAWRKESQEALGAIFDELKQIRQDQGRHDMADEKRFGAIEQEMAVTKAVAEKSGGPGKAGWATHIITGLTALGAAIGSYLSIKKGH